MSFWGGSGEKIEPVLRPTNPCALDISPERSWTVELEGSRKAALETGRTRLLVVACLFAIVFLAINLRLVDLSLPSEQGEEVAQAERSNAAPQGPRADILDRNGTILATTLPTTSLFANPKVLRDPQEAARHLSAIFAEMSESELLAKLSADRRFVWIKRHLSPRETEAVLQAGIVGLDFLKEEKRAYPHGSLGSHIIGFTDIDNQGLAGMERAFDESLSSSGRPLELSIDMRLQHILAEELAASMESFSGIGAAGLILDAKSGEVLSMVSLPDFDPNDPGNAAPEARFNRASLGVYEMGSIFKIFTTALSLDSGAVSLNGGYDISKPIRIARFTINDFKPKNRWASIPEIFMYSSNIGTVHMAMEAGTETLRSYFTDFGLTSSIRYELPEVGQPMLPKVWRPINTMTASYGHGIAVTPLQTARAIAAVVNGGRLPSVTLLKRKPGEKAFGPQVIGERTSEAMRQMMRLVVVGGTGKKAEAAGYLVGGKTGTADKLNPSGGYAQDKRIASFAGAFPMDDPRYVILVMVDEPKGKKETYGYATGGWVAAPVVGRVVERAAPLLGISPREDDDHFGADLLVNANWKGKKLVAQ